jgi:ADP-ribosylglycohydrolase
LNPGQVTDDSEMAMCILHGLTDSIKDGKATLNLDILQSYFGRWYQSNPFDIGITTREALRVIRLDRLDPYVSY